MKPNEELIKVLISDEEFKNYTSGQTTYYDIPDVDPHGLHSMKHPL